MLLEHFFKFYFYLSIVFSSVSQKEFFFSGVLGVALFVYDLLQSTGVDILTDRSRSTVAFVVCGTEPPGDFDPTLLAAR